MMSVEENIMVNDIQIDHRCKKCGGKGKAQIFRSDLEEYEEIECNYCK